MDTPTCVPHFIPPVNLDIHSKTAGEWFYVIMEGWTPNIYTNSIAAEAQILRYSNPVQRRVKDHQTALGLWASHCRSQHPKPCPKCVQIWWGIKGIKKKLPSSNDEDEVMKFVAGR
ncbi:hypothetical protein B0H17DRAFT_1144800 [Mycena rosella]|uniref:Uncharacterized protein n=1 Tax=Mycena rosella TaxID=1033263 RepID=A0AAD7CSJ0_MYCRO|nr:hypothetical protein B0H17DRAFT_1144800 [Mycena rosella]